MKVASAAVGIVGALILITTGVLLIGSYRDLQRSRLSLPSSMKLTSTAFQNNQSIPPRYTCDGENVNPPLIISEIPVKAKSLVLIIDDPDAPRGDFVHWTLWNIPPDTKEIAENSIPPDAVQGYTDFGRPGYGGPCPPSGVHRYQFKLYALNTMLDLPVTAKKSDILHVMTGRIIEETILIGLYTK